MDRFSVVDFYAGDLEYTDVCAKHSCYSVSFKYVPGYSFIGTYSNTAEFISRISVPGIIMAIGLVATLGRVTRSSMISQLQAPYMITAKAKGLGKFNKTFKHAFHNAVIPVLTVAGYMFAGAIGSTVLIEQIFSLRYRWYAGNRYPAKQLSDSTGACACNACFISYNEFCCRYSLCSG